MIRAVVTPEHQDISIHVPADYVGRVLEILLYPVDELAEVQPLRQSIASLRGSLKLTTEEYKDFQQYIKEVRNEWDENI